MMDSLPSRHRMDSLEQAAVSICSATCEVRSQHCHDSPACLTVSGEQLQFQAVCPQPGRKEKGRPEPAAAVLLYEKNKS